MVGEGRGREEIDGEEEGGLNHFSKINYLIIFLKVHGKEA